MKEMTTAEFRRTDLEALEAPVVLRRYKKVLGTYYPSSFEPSSVVLDAPEPSKVQSERIRELEEENQHLKQVLSAQGWAAEAVRAPQSLPTGNEELVSVARRTVKTPKAPDNALKGLPDQDREFFERKLGRKR